jgi:hypothetical protein
MRGDNTLTADVGGRVASVTRPNHPTATPTIK